MTQHPHFLLYELKDFEDDEYDDDDDILSPKETARIAANMTFDTAHGHLVSVLNDLNSVQQIHYTVCFRETITTKEDAATTLLLVNSAFATALADYLSLSQNFTWRPRNV